MSSLFTRSLSAILTAGFVWGLAQSGQAQAPNMPASPLAGGQAAMGGAYMDAYGNPIVLPAQYAEGCPGYGPECQSCGPYGPCDDGACYGYGGYDENAYADFGGYSQPDQCGPHYFDVAVSGVALRPEEIFNDVPPLANAGVGIFDPGTGQTIPDRPLLDPQNEYGDYEPGWQIAARYDIGALALLEMTYMGIYDIGFNDSVLSADVNNGTPNSLTSVFSQYGTVPIIGLESVNRFTLDYQSDLQSTEFSYRRYWVGYNPRITGTYLAGFRYIRMTEDMTFDSEAGGGQDDASLLWSDENDLVGAQLGGDGWICILQGLRIGAEAKAGIYNNRFKFRHATAVPDPSITNVDFTVEDDQVAFACEFGVDMVADILPSISLRGGYRAMYLNSLATVGNNIFPNEFVDGVGDTQVLTQADALYHGFTGGIEYVW
jgi:hypothetical protein